MIVIYTAGPITHESQNVRWQFIQTARTYAWDIWRRGYVALCPHLNTWGFDDPLIPSAHFYEGDLVLIDRCCDAMLMLPGWRDSKGSVKEHEFAKKHGLPVFYYTEINLLWDWAEALTDSKNELLMEGKNAIHC